MTSVVGRPLSPSRPASAQAKSLIGAVIGKYMIKDVLGEGGMGHVYLAEHVKMRRQVAIKLLPNAHSSSPSKIAAFEREARAAASLNHPNIVQAYDIDQDLGYHFIVMEFVPGADARRYVEKFGPTTWYYAADMIAQVAGALDHAHRAGIVHRDIKPSNLMISLDGVVKLADLGLALCHDDRAASPTAPRGTDNEVCGTHDFLAPEQAVDSQLVDARADIYSLGATFYFLLTGVAPFYFVPTHKKALAHQSQAPRPIKELAPQVPDWIISTVNRMLAKRLEERYQFAAEIVRDVAPYARRLDRPYDAERRSAPAPIANTPSGTFIVPALANGSGVYPAVAPGSGTYPAIPTPSTPIPGSLHGSANTSGPGSSVFPTPTPSGSFPTPNGSSVHAPAPPPTAAVLPPVFAKEASRRRRIIYHGLRELLGHDFALSVVQMVEAECPVTEPFSVNNVVARVGKVVNLGNRRHEVFSSLIKRSMLTVEELGDDPFQPAVPLTPTPAARPGDTVAASDEDTNGGDGKTVYYFRGRAYSS